MITSWRKKHSGERGVPHKLGIGKLRKGHIGKESWIGDLKLKRQKSEKLISRAANRPSEGSSPSKVTDEFWLFAERQDGSYPEHGQHGGKWLLFIPVVRIDEVWAAIKAATELGKLGSSSKVATARPNPNEARPGMKVICVYTYDWTDERDVRRVREALRDLGVTWKISYKADADTRSGRYAKRGDTRISKYFE